MRVVRALLKIFTYSKIWPLGMIGVIIVVAIVNNVKPYLVKMMIDHALDPDRHIVIFMIVAYALSQIINASAWSFSDWLVTRYNAGFRIYINNYCLSMISKYSYSFFQDQLAGSILNKLSDIFDRLYSLIFSVNIQFNQFILTTLITLYLLLQVHIYFAAGLLLWMTIFLTLTFFNLRKANYVTQNYAETKSILKGQIGDYISNILSIRLFSAFNYEAQRMMPMTKDFIDKSQALGRCFMKFYIIQGIIVTVYALMFITVLVILYRQRYLTAGDFTLVIMLHFNTFEELYELSHHLTDFVENWGTVDQALKILEHPLEIQDKMDAKALQVTQAAISFRDVTFHYKGHQALFEHLNVHIESGQKVGLVGHSGSGKSTFIKLLLRLYEINDGMITIDGQSIQDVKQDSLRQAIALIPQEPEMFHRSLMDNIRYGRHNATDNDVIMAAQQAQAHDFVISLPEGYDTLVGERGIKLSGGQRQRIAIARALLKSAPLLILDEATSQLDSLTENEIQQALLAFMNQDNNHGQQPKTTIIIAHRLSTLLHVDRILVFYQGRIIEDGSHDELIQHDGHYKSLWDAQIGGFIT